MNDFPQSINIDCNNVNTSALVAAAARSSHDKVHADLASSDLTDLGCTPCGVFPYSPGKVGMAAIRESTEATASIRVQSGA
jgi:hypothetical protein